MAGSINKAILIGNLGKDPEVRRLESGAVVCSFPIATSETYKDKTGQKVSKTEWHNIVMWRGLAEIAEKYLKKGSSVYIEGKIKTRSWEDQENNMRYTTEIVADQMTMLGNKSDSQDNSNYGGESSNQASNQAAANNQTAPAGQNDFSAGDDEDDLPF